MFLITYFNLLISLLRTFFMYLEVIRAFSSNFLNSFMFL